MGGQKKVSFSTVSKAPPLREYKSQKHQQIEGTFTFLDQLLHGQPRLAKKYMVLVAATVEQNRTEQRSIHDKNRKNTTKNATNTMRKMSKNGTKCHF